MNRFEYGVIDDDDFVYAPDGLSREEAIRMACSLGAGHMPVKRTCQDWATFDTGIVNPCLPGR